MPIAVPEVAHVFKAGRSLQTQGGIGKMGNLIADTRGLAVEACAGFSFY